MGAHVRILAAALLACPVAAADDNLLKNPGFEEGPETAPHHWNHYVQPPEGSTGLDGSLPGGLGAFAELDDAAHSGERAALLHIAIPYDRDPMNNWSQNVMADVAEKTLQLEGYIKVEAATSARIIAQCWHKDSRRVLYTASTANETPIAGTQDWTRAATTFSVPKGADFIVVRCVLSGSGSAWFDDLVLTTKGGTAPEGETTDDEAAAEEPGKPEPPAPPAVDERLGEMRQEVDRLREVNRDLVDMIAELRESNAALRGNLTELRAALRELTTQLAPPELPDRVPPLVPHREAEPETP